MTEVCSDCEAAWMLMLRGLERLKEDVAAPSPLPGVAAEGAALARLGLRRAVHCGHQSSEGPCALVAFIGHVNAGDPDEALEVYQGHLFKRRDLEAYEMYVTFGECWLHARGRLELDVSAQLARIDLHFPWNKSMSIDQAAAHLGLGFYGMRLSCIQWVSESRFRAEWSIVPTMKAAIVPAYNIDPTILAKLESPESLPQKLSFFPRYRDN